jgi:hypothetical protein
MSAIGWLEGTLLGTVATVAAIIAIASVGILMITGRIDVRRAAQVVFGCFIVFGASTIASGIMGALSGTASRDLAQAPPPAPPLPSPPATARTPSTPYDPYAGAALPQR